MSQAPTQPKIIIPLAKIAKRTDTGFKPAVELDPRTYDRALDCVHCGLCLPACPTYTENGLEADSPRGRIYLMKGLADGQIDATPTVVEHLDLCLDCRACETACPSGVVYHELIEETRTKLDPLRKRTLVDRWVEFMFYRVFPYPKRLKWAMLPARLLQKVGLWELIVRSGLTKMFPVKIDKMQQMLPKRGRLWESNLQERYPAYGHAKVDVSGPLSLSGGEGKGRGEGEGRGSAKRTGESSDAKGAAGAVHPPLAPPSREGDRSTASPTRPRATVALLSGCVGSVLFQDVNRQTVRVLQESGCDVLVPPAQACCGAIHHHGARHELAVAFAKANIDAFFPKDDPQSHPDFLVNNIAGCGAMLKDYAHLLRDDPEYAERAKQLVARTRDISELLVELDPPKPKRELDRTVTYHDACHLAHAQKLPGPPRRVLSWIKGLRVVPLAESDMCCGAAGTYNLAQPVMARQLAERKVRHVERTKARVCVTANAGCAMQIQSEAERMGVELHVTHPITLLYEAYFGDDAP